MLKLPLVPKWPNVTLSQWLGRLGTVNVTGNTSISGNWSYIQEFPMYPGIQLMCPGIYLMYPGILLMCLGIHPMCLGILLMCLGIHLMSLGIHLMSLEIHLCLWEYINKVKFGVY
jgi:hypothetical protein